jgi:DNA-directed RNA polymerase subunit RPC12/RpoP
MSGGFDGAKERYFCVMCESVFITDMMPKDDVGTVCPLCGSHNIRLWEKGGKVPNYYGRQPEEE